MDKAQMCERTGIRDRRIHAAAGRTQVFRRGSGWLLPKRKAHFCRESRHWIYDEIFGDAAQKIPRRSAR